MAKAKTAKKSPRAKVADLKPKKDPKGGLPRLRKY